MKNSKSVSEIDISLRRRGLSGSNSEPGVVSSSSSLSSSGSSHHVGELGTGLRSSKKQNRSGSSSSLELKSARSVDTLSNPDSDSETPSKPSSEEIARTKLMLQGAKKFNMDPKKGIDFLVLNGLFQRTPEDVAQVCCINITCINLPCFAIYILQ